MAEDRATIEREVMDRERKREQVEGWRNYPTFLMAVLLRSTKIHYDNTRAQAIAIDATHEGSTDEKALFLGDRLKEQFEYLIDKFEKRDNSGYLTSMMRASFDSVDWFEIGQDWFATINEEKEHTQCSK